MVVPSGTMGPEGVGDFPLVETFRDCCGGTRRFEVSMNVTEGGFFLRATEDREDGGGYEFAAHHTSSPYVALGILRARIAEGLATRYMVIDGDGRRLGHDRAVGHVGYGCVVIDGEEIPFDEFVTLIQAYEGWRFDIQITDAFDAL